MPSGAARPQGGAQVGQRRPRVDQPGGPGQVGHHGVQQLADGQRVGGPARVAQVVLQHPPAAELVADQVEAHHRRPDDARRAAAAPRPASRASPPPGRGPARRRRSAAARRRRPAGTPRPPGPAGPRPSASACHSCGLTTRGTRSTCEPPLLALDAEGQPAGVDPGVALRPPAAAISSGGQPPVVVDEVAVGGPRLQAGADGLVARPGPVAAQGRDGRLGPAGRAVGLGDHQLDDVAQPAALGEGGPLPVGAVAAGQRGLAELQHLVPVAELLQLRAAAGAPASGRPRRAGCGLGVAQVVQQLTAQPAARRPPDRRPGAAARAPARRAGSWRCRPRPRGRRPGTARR